MAQRSLLSMRSQPRFQCGNPITSNLGYYDLVQVKESIRLSIEKRNAFSEEQLELCRDILIRVDELKSLLESKIEGSKQSDS